MGVEHIAPEGFHVIGDGLAGHGHGHRVERHLQTWRPDVGQHALQVSDREHEVGLTRLQSLEDAGDAEAAGMIGDHSRRLDRALPGRLPWLVLVAGAGGEEQVRALELRGNLRRTTEEGEAALP